MTLDCRPAVTLPSKRPNKLEYTQEYKIANKREWLSILPHCEHIVKLFIIPNFLKFFVNWWTPKHHFFHTLGVRGPHIENLRFNYYKPYEMYFITGGPQNQLILS